MTGRADKIGEIEKIEISERFVFMTKAPVALDFVAAGKVAKPKFNQGFKIVSEAFRGIANGV